MSFDKLRMSEIFINFKYYHITKILFDNLLFPQKLYHESSGEVMVKKQKCQIIISIFLFLLVLTILGIPYTKWGFQTDDFSNIYHSFIKSYKDIFRFFYEGSIETFLYPSGVEAKGAFFSGLYRPMSFIFYLPQVFFFGINPYGYFLTTIALHTINAVILFNILFAYFPILFSFLAAAYFAFHPSLYRLGWISAQSYQIELLLLFFIIFSLKKYIDSKKISFYILSCLLLLTTLCLKEACVVFALWSIPAVYIYTKNLKQSLLTSIGYWVVTIFYLIIRAIVLPITSNTGTFHCEPNWTSFIARQKEKLIDFVSFFSDMIGLNWLPGNNRLIKGSIIVTVCLLLLYLFIKNRKKNYIMFFLFSMLIFSWPALLIQHKPRYIYMSLIFFTIAVIISLAYSKIPLTRYRYAGTLFLCTLISYNAYYLTQELTKREVMYNFATTSFQTLAQNKTFQQAMNGGYSFCMVTSNMPGILNVATAQAIWLMTQNDSYNVYHSKPNTKEKILCIDWDTKEQKFKIIKNCYNPISY